MTLWVFTYGSLMADGWETAYHCKVRSPAILPGHSRSFDKGSIESRGTREHPAPTLRIIASSGECHGVAFEFDDEQHDTILADLLRREGKTFPLRERTIRLPGGGSVTALVPIYEGKRIIRYGSLRELAEMAISAKGTRSNGVEYVRSVAKHLDDAGVEDKAVSDLLFEIEACLREATRP